MITAIVLTPILIYASINVAYYFIFSLASLKKLKAKNEESQKFNKIAVFIPAYKEDAVIVDTATKALKQQYPTDQYDVVVIADSLQHQTLTSLCQLPIKVVEVAFEKSTKTKAINRAFAQLDNNYDIAVVLDADNTMAPDFLAKVNGTYVTGSLAIQGHRTAKNDENEMAILDGISEEINNNIFRKGHVSLGLSSALIGSGMAFDYQLFKHHMSQIKAIGGFDKELELRLLKDRVKIDYLEDAMVFDEKVSSSKVFEKQRTRWLAAQFRYAFRSIGEATQQLITKGKIDYFDKSFQFFLLPRILLLGLLGTLFFISWIPAFYGVEVIRILSGIYGLTLSMAVPRSFYNLRLLKALLHLPVTFLSMVRAMANYKKAATSFLHTPHQTVKS